MDFKEIFRLLVLVVLLLLAIVVAGITATREYGKSKPAPDKGITSAEDVVNKQMGDDGENYKYIWFLEQSERVEESLATEEINKIELEEYKESLKGLKMFYKGSVKRDIKRLEKKYNDSVKTTDKLMDDYNDKSEKADPEIFGDKLELKITR